MNRIALPLLMLVLGLSIAVARANDIIYNIVDYPANEVDTVSATDTVSGTIITDGTIGPLSESNIIGGTFSLTSPNFGVSGTASFGVPIGLEATPTQLLLDPGVDSSFSIGTTYVYYDGETGVMGAQVVYENDPGSGQYYSSAGGSFGTMSFVFPSFDSAPVPTTQGSIGANASWVVATVPEPSTFVLFCIGAVSLAAHAWRRKRRGA
jgi:hypothetical protein